MITVRKVSRIKFNYAVSLPIFIQELLRKKKPSLKHPVIHVDQTGLDF